VAIPFSSVLATPPFGGGPGFLATSTYKFFTGFPSERILILNSFSPFMFPKN
jgi:hypothetical protein